ncbi:hypothetical protein JJB09_17710 [Rhizobium sp. KVB221]|uniref:Uncharacterized protein n=1 Tax=Rhizobium setariae TaxID=2801340 RepID=A0A936YQK1_9HYPH|nr:hypothetical protein [Rhizobium setariae]MBL0373863.1 hypothetical protein [Rhizobium setariae]
MLDKSERQERLDRLHDLIESRLLMIVADANRDGFATDEALYAIEKAIGEQWQALEQDPDPADDPE